MLSLFLSSFCLVLYASTAHAEAQMKSFHAAMEFFPASLRGSSSSTQVIPSVVLAVLGLATARALYYLFFHPLNRYPGPKLWAVSRAFHVWYNFTGRLPFKVLELHRKYGPVVRIAPDELSFTDAAAWDDVRIAKSSLMKAVDPENNLQ